MYGSGSGVGEHEAGSYDTPTAPGVTVSDWGTVSLGVPQMAVVGEPLHLMVSNFGEADNGYVSAGGDRKHIMQAFTTGSASNLYRLEGIAFNVEGSEDGLETPRCLTVRRRCRWLCTPCPLPTSNSASSCST